MPASWEQRRRGIMRTALEMERDLFSAENRYIAELRTGMTDMQLEMVARLGQMNAQPRADGQFDWEKSQVESLIAELNRQIDQWAPRATSTVQAGTADADARGSAYPKAVLDAGGSTVRAQPRLGGNQLAMFHAYDAGLVRGVSERTRADITGLIRRAALGGDSVFSLINSIGTVAGKGAFATAFHRGEAIVRTEMGRAYSSASMATMNQSALDHPGLKKKWLSIIDGRVRPEHAAAHDQVRELNQPFSVGGERLMHPHDTTGSAWNTINCRCKAVPWDPAWDKLPPPGTEAVLGPLVKADTASFQQRLAELDRNSPGDGGHPYNWTEGVFRSRTFGGTPGRSVWAQMDAAVNAAPWPTPMNPAFWRSKTGFTLAELKQLSSSGRLLGGFLTERYGIQLVQNPGFTDLQRLKLLQALETYRALDPSLVVENPRLRWVGTDMLGPGLLGQASIFGDIAWDPRVMALLEGRTRDSAGQHAPRLSDDGVLEVFLHEIAHSISYNYNMPASAPTMSLAALPAAAWSEFTSIHNNSTRTSAATLKQQLDLLERQLHAAEAQLAANRSFGNPDTDLDSATLIADIRNLTIQRNHTRATYSLAGQWSGGLYPSDYARENISEDFAESLALAQLQPAEFKTNYAPRYAWFVKWAPKLVGA